MLPHEPIHNAQLFELQRSVWKTVKRTGVSRIRLPIRRRANLDGNFCKDESYELLFF